MFTAGNGSSSDDLLAGVERLLELHYEKLSNLIGERLQHVPQATMLKSLEHHADPIHTQTPVASHEPTPPDSEEKPGTNLNELVFAPQPNKRFGDNGAPVHPMSKSRLSSGPALLVQDEKGKSGVVCPHLKFVNDNWFELLSATMVILNSIFYGAEVNYLAENLTMETHRAFVVANYLFAIIFLTELILRICCNSIEFFCKSKCLAWNYFDVFVVIVSLIDVTLTTANTDPGADITYIRVLRIARIARLLRVVRLLRFFRPMRVLVLSVMNTLKSLTWTALLLVTILFLFGVMYTQAATAYFTDDFCNATGRTCPPSKNDVENTELFYYFGTVPKAILSLFKTLTGGVSWQEVLVPVEELGMFWATFFIAFISFCYLAVLNIVTGIVCSSSIEGAIEDLDLQVQAHVANKDKFTKQLSKLFEDIDEDHSGNITRQELEDAIHADEKQSADVFSAIGISVETALQLSALLDLDGNRTIGIEEFVEGCLKLRGNAKATDMHLLMAESHTSNRKLTALVEYFEEDFRSEIHEQFQIAMSKSAAGPFSAVSFSTATTESGP